MFAKVVKVNAYLQEMFLLNAVEKVHVNVGLTLPLKHKGRVS